MSSNHPFYSVTVKDFPYLQIILIALMSRTISLKLLTGHIR